jgi:hypothetical protein
MKFLASAALAALLVAAPGALAVRPHACARAARRTKPHTAGAVQPKLPSAPFAAPRRLARRRCR